MGLRTSLTYLHRPHLTPTPPPPAMTLSSTSAEIQPCYQRYIQCSMHACMSFDDWYFSIVGRMMTAKTRGRSEFQSLFQPPCSYAISRVMKRRSMRNSGTLYHLTGRFSMRRQRHWAILNHWPQLRQNVNCPCSGGGHRIQRQPYYAMVRQ